MSIHFYFLFKVFGITISIEGITIIISVIAILVSVFLGIPAIKTWNFERKKILLKQKTLFKTSGWINTSQITFSNLDTFREMKEERNPSSQKGIKESLRKILDERKDHEIHNHILMIGPSLSGKSHITVSVLKILTDAYVLIPDENTFNEAAKDNYELPNPPENARYKVILLDNFHEFFKDNVQSLKSLLNTAVAKGFTIWANCISIEEYTKVNSLLDFKSSSLELFQEIPLENKLNKFEAEYISRSLGKEKLSSSFNGLIGEIFYPPTDMIQHYGDLKTDAIAFDVLLFIKQAYMLGAFTLPYLMNLELIKRAFVKKYSPDFIPLMVALRKIETKGFIKLLNDHSSISFDSVWLNEIVEPQMIGRDFFIFWENLIPKNSYKSALERYDKIERGKADVIIYNSIISKCPTYEEAVDWFNKIEKSKADVFTYNPLISKSPDYKTAVNWFNKIQHGKANVVTYSALIHQSPDYKTALTWYHNIGEGEANFITYNSLIDKSPDYETALKWYNKIGKELVTVITYNSLIYKSPDYETALKWFQKIEMEDVTQVTYSSLINKSPDYQTALEWFRKIEEGKANVITYNSLINKSPDYETAIGWYYNIEKGEVNNITYNSLINKSLDLDIALNWLHKMEINNFLIDEYTYSALLKVIARSHKSNKYQVAITFYNDMVKREIFPNVAILTLLISMAPNFEEAFKLLQLMITQKDKNGDIIIANQRTKTALESKANGNPEKLVIVQNWFQENAALKSNF